MASITTPLEAHVVIFADGAFWLVVWVALISFVIWVILFSFIAIIVLVVRFETLEGFDGCLDGCRVILEVAGKMSPV